VPHGHNGKRAPSESLTRGVAVLRCCAGGKRTWGVTWVVYTPACYCNTATPLVKHVVGVAELRRVGQQVNSFGQRVGDDPAAGPAAPVLRTPDAMKGRGLRSS
jgi:hypothetical protein